MDGEIWRADDHLLGRTVAGNAVLPVLATDPELTTRFHADALAMAGLHHPPIVDAYDYSRAGGVAFSGHPVDARPGCSPPAAPAEVMTIVDVATALGRRHATAGWSTASSSRATCRCGWGGGGRVDRLWYRAAARTGLT
jgi:serine/threonine-protein kinase